MPADPERGAVGAYVQYLHESLSCITEARLTINADTNFHFTVKFDDITPAAALSTSGLQLLFAQGLSVQQNSGAWRVILEAYIYTVQDAQKGPLFSYEWHPRSGMNKCHFPTGHIAIEQVVRFLILEMKVPALRPDWDEVLTTNQKRAETQSYFS